jgi:hypothetical protein
MYVVAGCMGKIIFMIFYVVQDHAGHIFGVDSSPMIEKLEQYNDILEVCLFNIYIQSVFLILYFASMNSGSMFILLLAQIKSL